MAPKVLWELGAEVVAVGVKPDGININRSCGATAPAMLQSEVLANGADLGIALDGDADRLILVDEKGRQVDGDQLMGMVGALLVRSGPAEEATASSPPSCPTWGLSVT